jgi:hypothetical protein
MPWPAPQGISNDYRQLSPLLLETLRTCADALVAAADVTDRDPVLAYRPLTRPDFPSIELNEWAHKDSNLGPAD